MITKSPDIALLSAALLAAQKEIAPVIKDADNPYFKSKYADLGQIIELTRPILNSHGLSVSQHPESKPELKVCGCTTLLLHESGQFLESTLLLPLPNEKWDAQASGAAVTYARRYAWQSVIGLSATEDDDAESVRAPKAAAKEPASRRVPRGSKIPEGDGPPPIADMLKSYLDEKKIPLKFVLDRLKEDSSVAADVEELKQLTEPMLNNLFRNREKINIAFQDSLRGSQ